MSFKQTQQLQQKQRLSPLQVQTIKLIELPLQELEQKIQKELEENPAVDEIIDDTPDEDGQVKKVSLNEYGASDYTPSYKTYVNNHGKDAKPEYNTFSVKESFKENLENQLGFCKIDDRTRQMASYVIGSLEEDGYLRRDLLSLSYDIMLRLNIYTDEQELEKILEMIQRFEPAGIGARDLRECLLLQLRNKEQTPDRQVAMEILDKLYEEFARKHYDKIMSKLSIDEEELRAAQAEILALNPRPGGQIEVSYAEQAQQIVPDFKVEVKDGEPVVSMPKFKVPEVRISSTYAAMASDSSNREAQVFAKQKIESAKWYLEAIKQRQKTLQKTMTAIVGFQHDYFIDGDETKLRPMVLRDIAEITGLDISTISRVANSKYVDTHFGVISLKHFFSEGLVNSEGEEVSTREIKSVLQNVISKESKKKPLTDEQLVAVLKEKGYNVARRTIAKYREQLGIPIARMRKEL